MNFQDIYKKIYEIDSGKVVEKTASLSEKCGMPPAMNSPYRPPVTMNVSMNATGPESIRDLIDLISGEAMKEKEMDAAILKLGTQEDQAMETDIDQALEEFDNEPDEAYQDTAYMTKDLAGGLNKQHAQFKKEYPGDNPMAVESVYQQELKNLYQEIKNR